MCRSGPTRTRTSGQRPPAGRRLLLAPGGRGVAHGDGSVGCDSVGGSGDVARPGERVPMRDLAQPLRMNARSRAGPTESSPRPILGSTPVQGVRRPCRRRPGQPVRNRSRVRSPYGVTERQLGVLRPGEQVGAHGTPAARSRRRRARSSAAADVAFGSRRVRGSLQAAQFDGFFEPLQAAWTPLHDVTREGLLPRRRLRFCDVLPSSPLGDQIYMAG
jgi:hypothetical protein